MKTSKKDRLNLTIGCSDSSMNGDNTTNTQDTIIKALQHFNISGASLSYGVGVWRGQLEKNITLSIINNFTDGDSFKTLSNNLYIYLLKELKQEEITTVIDKVNTNL